MESACTHSY